MIKNVSAQSGAFTLCYLRKLILLGKTPSA